MAQLGSTTTTPSSTSSGSSAASTQDDALAFARCMRSHGVPNYPDPTGSGLVKESLQQLGVSSSRFQSASSDCNHLLPNGGQRAEPCPGAAGQSAGAPVLRSACAATASRTSPTPAATVAYPTPPPLESIRVRRSSRPQTRPAGSTGRPTCPRMPPTTPTPGHRGHECGDRPERGPLGPGFFTLIERLADPGRDRLGRRAPQSFWFPSPWSWGPRPRAPGPWG